MASTDKSEGLATLSKIAIIPRRFESMAENRERRAVREAGNGIVSAQTIFMV
jgi:hypothetical protein